MTSILPFLFGVTFSSAALLATPTHNPNGGNEGNPMNKLQQLHEVPQDGLHPIRFFGQSTNNHTSTKIDDDAAEELQREIDALRKKFKELEAKMEGSSSTGELETIQKQMTDLNMELEGMYKRIDDLSKELQQEFKQQMDEFQSQIVKANNELSDRVTALENQIEQNNINMVIGNIRQGLLEVASYTFKNLRAPLLAIPRIVKESYKKEVGKCQNVLEFIVAIEVESSDARLQNEIKASGFTTLYDQLRDEQFTDQGSDCLMMMAYQAFKLWQTLYGWEEKAKSQFRMLFETMPSGAESIIREYSSHFRKDQGGCSFSSQQEEDDYKNGKYVGDLNWWTAETNDEGNYFKVVDPREQPLEGNGNSESVFLAMPSGWDNENQLWKIIVTSNERIQLKHKVSGKKVTKVEEWRSRAVRIELCVRCRIDLY